MDPLDHLTETIVPAKKKGREHDGERWQLVIFLGEHCAWSKEHSMEEEGDYMSDCKALCPDPS